MNTAIQISHSFTRRAVILAGLAGVAFEHASAAERSNVTIYKAPQCGCCGEYADYLRQNGFPVTVVDSPDLTAIKKRFGVPRQLESCHTAIIAGYIVEGHVPVRTIARLLNEKPDIEGIALPEMPAGSPGMGGLKMAPFTVYEIGRERELRAYAIE